MFFPLRFTKDGCSPGFRSRRGILGGLFILIVLLSMTAHAQFTIDWYTVDGGGTSGSGGPFTLSGTIGQPDAGILAGGKLVGGFWALIAPLPPVLTITRSGVNVTISWPSPSTGFVLQRNTDLSTTIWNNVAQVPSDNGTFKSVTLPATMVEYYRLSNP
jgi:hypothetical protein